MPGGFELCPPPPLMQTVLCRVVVVSNTLPSFWIFFLILRVSAQNYSVNFLKHAYFMVAPGRDDPVK